MNNAASLHLSRRSLLGAGVALIAARALPAAASAQGARFRRWKITDPAMPPRVVDSYKKGISRMLELPPTDPRNWYRNVLVHLFDCPHGNWWFLVWHRAYLGWLELTLRDLSGDAEFALPYWDWTDTPQVPATMFEGVLDPNDGAYIAAFGEFKAQFEPVVVTLYKSFSPEQKEALSKREWLYADGDPQRLWDRVQQHMFFDQPNARGLTATTPGLDALTRVAVSGPTVRTALQTPTFAGGEDDPAGFQSAMAANHSMGTVKGTLESQPHDNVHGAMTGGSGQAFMVHLLSPVDPIFFLHHGNLDRLWDVWTRRQKNQPSLSSSRLGRPTLPQGPEFDTWSNEPFLFFSDDKGNPVSKVKAGEYTEMKLFDYEYSSGFGEDEVQAPAVAAAQPQLFEGKVTAAAVEPGAVAGGFVAVPAAVLETKAPEASRQIAEITLGLTEADQGRRFSVLVSSGRGVAPVVAGAITVFGHAHGPATFTVPLPEELGVAPAAAETVQLDIRIVPIGAAAGPSPAAVAAPLPQVRAIQVRTN